MWDLAVREEDYKAVDAMLQRFSGAPLSYRVVPAHARQDSAAMMRVAEEARNLDARQSQIAARYVATFLQDFAAAEELARLDLQARRNAGIRLGAQMFLAWLDVARGRWSGAQRAFADAERMEGGHAVRVERAFAATLPFLEVPRADLARLRAEIGAWNPAGESATGPPLAAALRSQLRLYLLGLLSVRIGEHDAALTHARDMERLPAPPGGRDVVAALVGTVRADVALHRNRAEEALTHLTAATGQVPLELVVVRPFVNVREYTQEHARYLRALALVALNRHDEARRWLETSFQGSPLELVYLAPAHLQLAQLAERSDDNPRAVAHLRSLVKLWKDADAPLQDQVNAAQASLSRLQAR